MTRAIEDSYIIRTALWTAWEEYVRLAAKAQPEEDKKKWDQYADDVRHVLRKLYGE